MMTMQNFLADDSGATASEYALALALIVLSLFAALGVVARNVNTALTTASGKL